MWCQSALFRPRRQFADRANQSRLGIARRQTLRTATTGLYRSGTVRDPPHHSHPQGFDLVFTQPLDPASLASPQARSSVTVSSFTYIYHSNYGCPEIDTRAEKVGPLTLSPDRRTLTVPVEGLRKGRVYEIRLEGIRNERGETVLHPEAYYTLNELRR